MLAAIVWKWVLLLVWWAALFILATSVEVVAQCGCEFCRRLREEEQAEVRDGD